MVRISRTIRNQGREPANKPFTVTSDVGNLLKIKGRTVKLATLELACLEFLLNAGLLTRLDR